MSQIQVGRLYTRTILFLGKAANERSPRNAHLVHDGGERMQPTQPKSKVERVYSAYQKLEGAKIEPSLFLSKLTPNKRKLENLSFNIKGDAANHDGTLQVTTDNLMLNTQIHGHFSKNHWAADLTDLKLFDKALPKSKMERVYLPVS